MLTNNETVDREWPGDPGDAAEHIHLVYESGNEIFEVQRKDCLLLIPTSSVFAIEITGEWPESQRASGDG